MLTLTVYGQFGKKTKKRKEEEESTFSQQTK